MNLHIGNIIRKFLKFFYSGTIQKRLGYPAGTKLLIIHADDLGFSHSENTASIKAMEEGMVSSGSVMVPCSGFDEIVNYSKNNRDKDIGIHLTVLSEWDSVKWKPVLPGDAVPSLINQEGYFMENKEQLLLKADPREIENEYRAQIMHALNSGIDLTHIDSHMYSAFSKYEIVKKYIALGKTFRLPVLLTYNLPVRSWFLKDLIIVDQLYYARPGDFEKGLSNYYSTVLSTLNPGLNCLLVHTAINDKELQDITRGRTSYGSEWRQADYDFFMSAECRQLIQNNNIRLITWREIRDKIFRSAI